jgi:signal transduction histidine kinase
MNRQIQDLTDVSRIETEQLHVDLAPTHFSTIISETLLSVTGPCVAKEIEIKLDLPSELPPIMGDAGRLIQVLTNLLSNACKYSPEKTAITITLHAEEMAWPPNTPPRRMVICAVRDEGYGMSEEDVAKLFTKFFRSENPDIRKATGTGLGLVITQGLVELHNGRIWVESELGKGTTFSVAIPQNRE